MNYFKTGVLLIALTLLFVWVGGMLGGRQGAAMAFAVFFWILGHFSAEMRFVAEKSGNALLRSALLAFSWATPDFAHFDYRNAWHAGPPDPRWMAAGAVYALAYAGACFALCVLVFEQKEF